MPIRSFREHLKNGLRPDGKMGRDMPYCVEYTGLRPTPFGARAFLPIADTPNFEASYSYPFPQMQIGNAINLIGGVDTIKTLDIKSSTWAATAPTMLCKSGNSMTTTPLGGVWHFMDFYTTWMAFNGACTVTASLWDATPLINIFGQSVPQPLFLASTGWTVGANWAISGGGATHTPGATNTLSVTFANQSTKLLANQNYKVELNMTGRTVGSIGIGVGNGLAAGIVTNGVTTRTINSGAMGADKVEVFPSSDFDGTLLGLSVVPLKGVTINTGAAYNESQPFLAGFNPGDMFNCADWATFLATYNTNVPTEIAALPINGAQDMNWVWWGTVGGGDLMWLFDLALMKFASEAGSPDMGYIENYLTSGVLSDYDNYYFLQLMKRGEFGMRPMPWQGKCVGMKQLGRHMMVYGGLSNQEPTTTLETGMVLNKQRPGGIAGLFPSGNFWGMDFVRALPQHVGIEGRGAFGGNDEVHLIYDELDNLWLINASLEAKRLNYSSWLSGFGSDIMITHDPHEKEFYITDGADTLMLNDSGLCKAPWHPTTIAIAQGALVGVARDDSNPELIDITTEQVTAKGQLRYVDVIGKNNPSVPWGVSILWRVDSRQDWTETSEFSLDARGRYWFDLPLLNLDYKVHLSGVTPFVLVDDIEVLEQDGDHYNLRSLYNASTPGAATE